MIVGHSFQDGGSNNRILDIFYQLSLTNIQEDIKHVMWADLSARTPYRKTLRRVFSWFALVQNLEH